MSATLGRASFLVLILAGSVVPPALGDTIDKAFPDPAAARGVVLVAGVDEPQAIVKLAGSVTAFAAE